MQRSTIKRGEITRTRTSGIVDLPARKIAPTRLNGWPSRDLARVVDAYELQRGTIDAQAAKSLFAMRKLLELHQHSAFVTREVIDYLCYLDRSAAHLDGSHRDILAQAQREQMILFVEQSQGLLRLGGGAIGRDVSRTLRPPQKPGLLSRLLFGDKEMPPDE